MRRKSRIVSCFVLVCILLSVAGCFGGGGGGGGSKTYTVSGRVVRADNNQGIQGVTIAFSGGFGTATTETDGKWSKSGLKGTVTVTPSKQGWAFDPLTQQVSRAADNVNFVGVEANSITFVDPNLEAVVRDAIGKPTGEITDSDVMRLTSLDARDRGITNLEGIEYLVNLRYLHVGDNNISDLGPLAWLKNLEDLYAWYNQFDDLSPLAELDNLRILYFHKCNVSDLTPISELINLEILAGYGNQITDISPIAGLRNLRFLWLSDNPISDINIISGFTNLWHLALDRIPVSKEAFNVIAGLTHIERLGLCGNGLTDIGFLSNLTKLEWLYINNNQISDISVLAGMTCLEDLLIDGNEISDITPLAGLTELTRVWLGHNLVSNISAIAGLTKLEELYLHFNYITNITPLVDNLGLGAGDVIDLTYNQLDLSPGSDNMRDIDILIQRGAEVWYEPQSSDQFGQILLDGYRRQDMKFDLKDGRLLRP